MTWQAQQQRPSTLWHLLLSRAPSELQLPHHRAGWTAAQYVGWVDARHAAYSGASDAVVEVGGVKCVRGAARLTVGRDPLSASALAAEEDIWRR